MEHVTSFPLRGIPGSSDSTIYQSRAESGDYDRMVKNLKTLGKRALIGVEYAKDFERDGKRGFNHRVLHMDLW